MSKPFNNFEFATNSTYSTGPDMGTPTKVAPSAGEIDDGFVRDTAAVAQHVNWLFGQVQEWLYYLAGLASDSEFLDNPFHFTNTLEVDGAVSFNGTLDVDGAITIDQDTVRGTAISRTLVLPLSRGIKNAGGNVTYNNGAWHLEASDVTIAFPVELPTGCSITRVVVVFDKHEVSVTTPAYFWVRRYTPDFTTGAVAITDSPNFNAALGTGIEVVDSGPISAATNRAASHVEILVHAGDGAGAFPGDQHSIVAIKLEVLDGSTMPGK